MQLVDNDAFLDSIRDGGIAVQSGWPRLSFGRYEETDRFWVWPWPPQDILGMLGAVLEHTAPTTWCDAWRPGGSWYEDDPSYPDAIRDVLLRSFAIPRHHRGALRFERSESAAVNALVLSFVMTGWNVNDDLCLIPDNRQFIVRVSHHAVFHVECRTPELVGPLVEHMSARGWPLPTDVPDSTFKIPAWMNVRDPDAPA
jgi:hypothetical protein